MRLPLRFVIPPLLAPCGPRLRDRANGRTAHGALVHRRPRRSRQPDRQHRARPNAFLVCTFWYIDALAALGRLGEARALFTVVLRHGLLSENIDPVTHELWGNFAQTYCMVGLIGSAIRLSIPWDQAF